MRYCMAISPARDDITQILPPVRYSIANLLAHAIIRTTL